MRPPALAIATAFAGGIVLGDWQRLAHLSSSRYFLLAGFLGTVLLILCGVLLARLGRLFAAAAISVLSWITLGVLGAGIAGQSRPANHVLLLADVGAIGLKSPLRWHGRLRDEPARLPWGYGYEIELSGVEYEGSLLPVAGGMRLSFATHGGDAEPPDTRAGDEVTVLAEARRPQVYRDEGAFDRRAYLEQQNIDLVATLRAAKLMKRIAPARRTATTELAHARRRLREELDSLFGSTPEAATVLRAMLLGDRSFVDRTEATDFQKTGVFHVLVVAGLHVGALAVFLFWAGRKLRLSALWTALFTLAALSGYLAIVEQRPPVLRAALMTAIVVLGGLFYRRLELLNSAALAALLLLIAKPLAIRDSSFQLTFLAIGCIAGVAVPWLEKNVQVYVRALRGWRDVTRDAAHEPRAAQFRIDLRGAAKWISAHAPRNTEKFAESAVAGGLAFGFRVWELLVITVVLQVGMLPLMARDFHRITLSAPAVNLAAVPLTGLIVPTGFLSLGSGVLFPALGRLLATPLGWVTLALLRIVHWFAHFPRWSYRIPGPPGWLIVVFLGAGVLFAVTLRTTGPTQKRLSRAAVVALAVSAVTIATFPFGPRWSKGKLEMTVLDVGQGDSLFVVSPRGSTLLIDGGGAFGGFGGQEERSGPDPGEDAASPYLWSRGYRKVGVVALTHAHQDHIGGLRAVLENFQVGELWIGREVSSNALADLEKLAEERNIRIRHEMRGERFSWDGVEAQFLWPENSAEGLGAEPKNNDSLVLRLKYGERGVMLPGDAEKQAERQILTENERNALQSDVLKIGHHGSKNSTTPEFLAAVRPRVAVISAGEENPYGHPNPELLERLEGARVRVLRTDRNGAVHILTDGQHLEISCFVACREAASSAASAQPQPPYQQH